MNTRVTTSLVSLLVALLTAKAQYTTTVDPNNPPVSSEADQHGTNQCGTENNQTSLCQNLYVNSVTDFCLWGPPTPDLIGNVEQIVVSYCTLPGRGTRLIPQGAIKSAHFVETPNYIQITGVGDLTGLNIPANDQGGELDPHGPDGLGNPHGGLVFSNVWNAGQNNLGEQIHEWTNFMAHDEFCIRVCKPGADAATYCQHIYDVMGCRWNIPGDYNDGFDSCQGDNVIPMGLYPQPNGSTSTWYQDQTTTNTVLPSAQPAAATSACTSFESAQIFSAAPSQTTSAILTTSRTTTSTRTTTTRRTSTTRSGTPTSSNPAGTNSAGAGFASASISRSSVLSALGLGAFTLWFL